MTIFIGILMIMAGLSGEFVLKGTESGGLLALVGFGLVIWGVMRYYHEYR